MLILLRWTGERQQQGSAVRVVPALGKTAVEEQLGLYVKHL